jgi:hypothetical protein
MLAGIGLSSLGLSAAPWPYSDRWPLAVLLTLLAGLAIQFSRRGVRRIRERARQRALYEVREMLGDRVRNQLAVLALALPSPAESPDGTDLATARASISTIAQLLDQIDEDSLNRWRMQYAGSRVLANADAIEPLPPPPPLRAQVGRSRAARG